MSVLIEQAQRRGEIKASVDPALLAYNLFALHFSFLVVWLGTACGADPKPSMRQMLELHSRITGIAGGSKTRQS